MKNSYHLKEDGFEARWFEGTSHRDKAIIWMHGSGMNEKHCLADSEYLRRAGYSVLVLGFYFWKGMTKAMRAIPVDYVEKAVEELRHSGFEKIGIHGISSGAAYALLCASLIPEISLVLSICPFDYVMEEPKIFGKPTGRSWFSYRGKDCPCSLFTGQREKGFFGSLRAYRRQDTEHRGEFLRSLYENASLTEKSRIKVENMRADVLLVAPERDNEWPSPAAVRRMERRLKEAEYPYRVQTVIYPHASHLLGTYPPESWKKAFPAEKKWPEECNDARKDCFEQEFRFWRNGDKRAKRNRRGGVCLSLGAKMAVAVMRCIKKTGLIKGPSADLDAALKKARDYNRKHPFKEPTDRKADYQTIQVGQYPCLIIKPENGTRKAILFLHGGGDHDAWKMEVSFARRYGKRAGMDVYYPLYPPFTEASPAQTAEFIFNVYREMVKQYGADKVAVVGGSYGGFLAMQLLTRINRNNAEAAQARVEMPKLLIMNSPFAYPKTEEEWKRAADLERDDAMITPGAFRWMLALTMKLSPDTPDWLLYPADMDFRNAPEAYAFYTVEACSAVADAIQHSYVQAGAGEKMHMHMETGMMHCYASAPVFRESKRDFGKQIALLRQI